MSNLYICNEAQAIVLMIKRMADYVMSHPEPRFSPTFTSDVDLKENFEEECWA